MTTGQTFFKLYKEFKGSMSAYAGSLKGKLPQATSTGTGVFINMRIFPIVDSVMVDSLFGDAPFISVWGFVYT